MRATRGRVLGAAVVGVLVVDLLLGRPTPPGIVLLGLVLGCLNALLAIGIILVYRANRVINFAHGELGAFAGVLAVQLVFAGWNYFLAVTAALFAAATAAGLIEVLIIRRFRNAPRLLLTVATIGLAQLLVFAQLLVPRLFHQRALATRFRTPLSDVSITVHPVVFDGNYFLVVAVAVAAVIGLTLFLRSGAGIGVRAAAENSDRAALCGIPVRSLSTIVWIIAGTLSGAAAVLQAPIVGLQTGVLIGPGLLLRALTAAVIARMSSLPVAIAAAMGISIVEQALFWSLNRSNLIDGLLLVIILVTLTLQRRGRDRISDDEATSWDTIRPVRPVPAYLRRLPEVRLAQATLAALVLASAIGLPLLLSPSKQNLLAVIVVYALVAISLVVLSGWSGQVSLGQFGLVAAGAVTAARLATQAHADFILTALAGGLAGAAIALVLGLPALRLRGFFLAVTTLAFAVSTSTLLLTQTWIAPPISVVRPLLFGRIDLENDVSFYYVCLTVLALVLAAITGFRHSRAGRAVVAIRDNPRAAQSYGISPAVAKLSAFALSGFVAGVAGALLAYQQHGLPASQYAPQESLVAFAMTVIGGLGSLPGAVLGAVYVKGAQYLLQGGWAFLATGAGMLGLLIVFPGGLGQVLVAMRDVFLHAISRRHSRVEAPETDPTPPTATIGIGPLADMAQQGLS
jgi:branched-chain amino acid transport system permease protein